MTQKVITSNISQLSKKHRKIAKQIPLTVAKAQKRIADEAIALHQKTVRTWKHKPRFYARKTARGFTINTDSQVYAWVDFGTRVGKGKYPIVAKRAKALHFFGSYKAATKPRVIASYKAAYGKNEFYRRKVMHPGIKPRHFTDEIVKRMKPRRITILREEIKKAMGQ